MADLLTTYATIQTALRDYLGEAAKDVDPAIRGGYRLALAAALALGKPTKHRWSFLSPAATLEIWPSVEIDPDVTVTGDTYNAEDDTTEITATDDVFYALMVGKTIVITTVGSFVIVAYTSATVVTVSGDASTASADTFSIAADGRYCLPTDFGSLAGDFTFEAGTVQSRIQWTSESDVRRHHEVCLYTGDPRLVAIVPRKTSTTHDAKLGTLWEAWFWPIPSAVRTLDYRYDLRLSMLSAEVTPVGDEEFHGVVEAGCLAYAEILWRGGSGGKMKLYQTLLESAIISDAGRTLPANLGYNRDNSDGRDYPAMPVRQYPVTFTLRT